jgi:hypothetical protein
VKKDLDYVINHIEPTQGIIVVDDYRAQHTFGVAISVWEAVSSFKLVPIFMTAAKIYLGRPENNFQVGNILPKLNEAGIHYVIEDFENRQIIRLSGIDDQDMYTGKGVLRNWLPPYFSRNY